MTAASNLPDPSNKEWRGCPERLRRDGSTARDFDDPTKRVEATTTPEGAKGWADRAGSAQVPAGGHGLNVASDASPEGVRAETRRREDRAGGEPSNAPTAASAASLRDRFICRREGHKPTVTLFRGPVTTQPYMTTCQRCGKWFEAEPQVKP